MFSSREVTVYEVNHCSIFVIRKNFTIRKAIRRLAVKWHIHPIRPDKRTYTLGKIFWMWCKVKNTWRGASVH